MTTWDGEQSARTLGALILASSDVVVELRALGGRGGAGVTAGYFDSARAFIAAAEALDGLSCGIYFTLNPVHPALLARANNRTVPGLRTTTGDKDVVGRRFLLVDLDATRPSGISATEAEREAAFALAREIVTFLTERGFPEPAKADSGNGAHLLYRIDVPTEDNGLVAAVLRALAFRFDTASVKVDQSVHNPARICKLYGTLAMKGDSTPDRPHRRSRLFSVPEEFRVVPIERLREIAESVPREDPRARTPSAGRVDVESLLNAKGLAIAKSGPWNGGTRWVLETCPFNPDHADRSAFVVQFASGAIHAGCLHNGCAGKNWRELREILEPGRRDRRGGPVSLGSAPREGLDDSWPDPEPLPEDLPPVQAFDPTCLPDDLRAFVVDIAERMQCPPDYPAVATLIAIAGVVGRKVGIRPKRRDNWLVVANLWGCVIGRPGLLKTPAIMEPIRGLKRLELAAKKAFEARCAEFAADEVVDKQRRRLAENEIRKALDTGDEIKLASAKKRLDQQRSEPTRRRYLVNDSTVEKLGELLNENSNGLVVYRDELTGFLKSLDKEGQEGARSFYLEAWDGTQRYTYDRIERGTIDIEATTVSIIGAIQPGPIRGYLQHAINQTCQDDGLIQRFQLAVWPDVTGAWKNVDRWPDTEARTAFFNMLVRLDGLDVQTIEAQVDEHDADQIPFLHFAETAQVKFDAWREQLENRLRSGEDHPAVESHFAKYRSLVPSLALLLHLADQGAGPVSDFALDKALQWAVYLESHARRIYSVATGADVTAAKAITKKILSGAIQDGFVLRDVYRPKWASLATKEDCQRGVDLLVDLGWLRPIRERARSASPEDGGAPRMTYRINPAVLSKVAAKTDRTNEPEAIKAEPRPATPSASSVASPRQPTDKTDRTPRTEDLSVVSVASEGSRLAHGHAMSNAGLTSADRSVNSSCRSCGGERFWRRLGTETWTCGTCHPPVIDPSVTEWSDARGGAA